MKEDEPEIDESAVTLNDSDLHLIIDKESFLTGSPITDAGFGYIWAGVRATYGYTTGKICYQVKLVENCDVSHLEDEPNPNVLRVGWSIFHSSMQLGEEPLSYGYGGTGKASVDCKFKDYGSKFTEGDVVTAYLEFIDEDAVMTFSVNEDHFDVAYQVPQEQLKGKALAPHLLTKNTKFEVNFGQCEPWVPIKEGFVFANQVPLEERSLGPKRPEKRTDCEIIMLCGLPGCGKTTWAMNHCKENPDKHYNIIGTNALIDKMKVMGLPRKGNYSGRWDVLIEKCTKCLQRLMDIGCHRRRNFILDQTNVYPAAQRRKMRNFEGFIRKAVVIVPTDEEFKRRVEKRELEEGKDVPDSAVMEMKANFTLPDKGLFNEVVYTELSEPEAKPIVEKYNKEAINAGYIRRGPQGGGISNNQSFQGSNISSIKRFKGEYSQQRPRYDNYNRRGPPMQHGGGGGFRSGGGGFRSEGRPNNDRGMSRMGGGGGGSSGGWRGGGSGGGGRGRGGMGSDRGMGGGDRHMGGGDRHMGGSDRHMGDRNSGGDRNTGGDRSRQGGMDRNRQGGGMDRGPSGNQGGRSNQGGGGYERRDNRDSHRPKVWSD
ncbi:hypothetical protein AAG570_001258 [Ranatra chinensis]|uniref:B30.2/SPRY domain-containing protein n=1 Tax=Ranatra chinensis TaxID=642074 RepID=A0ABD0YZI0_9HEMI